MALVTAANVIARWVNPPTTPDPAQITVLIEDAEDLIAREFPDATDRVADGSLPLTRYTRVVSRVVIRHLDNPRGIRSENDGQGPFTRGITFAGDTPGELYLTDRDREDLADGEPDTGKAFAIDLMPAATRAALDAGTWFW